MSELELKPVQELRKPVGPHDLPCKLWCYECQDITAHELALVGGDPCQLCHDCNVALSAAEDAAWD